MICLEEYIKFVNRLDVNIVTKFFQIIGSYGGVDIENTTVLIYVYNVTENPYNL